MKKILSCLLALSLLVCGLACAYAEGEATMSVESSLFGSAFTTGKSTLKRDRGVTVTFGEDSAATLTLSLPEGQIDDSLIDASNAKVALVDGDGYYAAEYVFTATELEGEWKNGQLTYAIESGEFDLNRDLYLQTDNNSGREWSCLGGDGAGYYTYELVVSGIVYDGKPVADQVIPMNVLIYGYNYSSDAVNLYGEAGTAKPEAVIAPMANAPAAAEETLWLYAGDDIVPVLCDATADNFYAIWPEGKAAQGDVTVTLTNGKGAEKTLTADVDYVVAQHEGQTQIALTYINWAFQPVYTTLNIAIGEEVGSFDIASVYVYEAQQGGGGTTVDGTVTAYSFYGLANLTSWDQLISPPIYLLSAQKDDATVYYAEDEAGKGALVSDMTLAKQFDASGLEDRNVQLVGNSLYITSRSAKQTVAMTVDGAEVEFTKTYPGRKDAVSGGGSLLNPSTCDQALEALPGYVIPWGTKNWITNEKWAWQNGVNAAWTGIEVLPYSGKYQHSVDAGAAQAFTADRDVTWSIIGAHAEGTSISEDGVLTVAADEPTSAFFYVCATDANGEVGGVSIKVTAAQ